MLPDQNTEVGRVATLLGGAWALYAELITSYGAVILTTLGIAYAVFQFWARRREHRAIMRKHSTEEDTDGRK